MLNRIIDKIQFIRGIKISGEEMNASPDLLLYDHYAFVRQEFLFLGF